MGSVGVLMGIAALYFHEVYGMKGTELGFLYCIAGLSMAVAQSILTKPAAARLGERNCIMLGNVIRALSYILLIVVVHPWVPYIATVAVISSGALISPCMASTLSAISLDSIRGSMMGTFQAVGCFGNFLGPLAGGAVFVTPWHCHFAHARRFPSSLLHLL